jgi:hypothetical protein
VTLERVLTAGAVDKVQGYVFGAHFSADQVATLAGHHYATSTNAVAKGQAA